MPLIKLVKLDSHYCLDNWGDGETVYRLGRDITDWEEVSDDVDDLTFIKRYRYQLAKRRKQRVAQERKTYEALKAKFDAIPTTGSS